MCIKRPEGYLGDRKQEQNEQEQNKKLKAEIKGPLTQKDVVFFRKEAIWRQMNEYKNKYHELKNKHFKAKVEYESMMKQVVVLKEWYQSIIRVMGVICGEEFREESNIRTINLVVCEEETNSLNKIREDLECMVGWIIERVKSQYSKEERENIEKKTKNIEDISILSVENKMLKEKQERMEREISEMKKKMNVELRQKDRRESESLKRFCSSPLQLKQDNNIDDNKNNDLVRELKGNEEAEKHDTFNINENDTKKSIDGEPKTNSIRMNEEYVIDVLHEKIQVLMSTNQIITNQLNTFNDNNTDLEKQIFELKSKLRNLTEVDLNENVNYVNLKLSNKNLQEQISHLTKMNNLISKNMNKFENLEIEIKNHIDNEISNDKESLRKQIQKNESDLVRIRIIRDDLLSDNTILKSQIENQKPIEDLISLNELLNERLNNLEKDHLKKIDDQFTDDKLKELSKDELILKLNSLNKEIKEIEAVYQTCRDSMLSKFKTTAETDNLIKKLKIEKNKADQKYFASMRLKDSIQFESKLLKSQINKSKELIKNLNEIGKNNIKKIEILTNTVDDYKLLKNNALQENAKLLNINKLNTNINSSLESELKNLNKKILDLLDKNKTIELKLTHATITIDRLKISQKNAENNLKKLQSGDSASNLSEEKKQLQALRAITKCSICLNNWKDTVLMVCGHIFCHVCTKERLAARFRRCPTCNKNFSANDLLSIHL